MLPRSRSAEAKGGCEGMKYSKIWKCWWFPSVFTGNLFQWISRRNCFGQINIFITEIKLFQ